MPQVRRGQRRKESDGLHRDVPRRESQRKAVKEKGGETRLRAVGKSGWEKLCPEVAGESQEGLNAPVASGREHAGTMEGRGQPSQSLPDAG